MNVKVMGWILTLAVGVNAQHVPNQYEDGSADAYTDYEGNAVVPRIEERNGKRYYYWPHWDAWKNGKMQVQGERTQHPDAQWWPHAGLGLFICWGMPSVFEPNGEGWAGRWTQAKEDAGKFYPQAELWASTKGWNPEHYDPEKWMEAARKAGFQYSVLTLKHHGGYAMWDSDYSVYGVRQEMGGRDLVAPWVKACRNNGIKVGFYYSGMDWYFERDFMDFSMQAGTHVNWKGEKVKSLPKRPPSFKLAYDEFNQNSVKEVIEKFDPDLWWGDGGHGATADQIREWRPGIVCNNRGEGGDHATAEMFRMAQPQYVKNPVVANGWWWEENSIIQQGSWHYDKHLGEEVYPADRVLLELARCRCMGGNFLANIGPRPDGRMQDDAYRLFAEMAEWMETNSNSVFGINGGGPWPEKCNVPITCNDRTWYFHARKQDATKADPVVLQDCETKPVSVILMRTGDGISFEYKNNVLTFSIPEKLKARNVTDVVKVEFGNDFDPEPYRFRHW
ncbi:alpha-L-fucosidase [Pontiella agarivorans]|uniref:alpha-L-fucosidase n=1 Tax=Pontiella agarivorans TaxID=3038953 RepID=A0ABU5MW68_9BACT|nr:alpha-L-fucosidase [Pontiella agarivorans]MDZ8118452.1 alpha-L-fucosidase [Pontiella agarivorans]